MSRLRPFTEQQIVDAITSRGLQITPVGSAGAVRIRGADIDVLAASLFTLDFRDLRVQPLKDDRLRYVRQES
ncbi:hypothetical protein SRS16CHR_01796 [Variovorax sp. SRS16]|uniref:hypothetical protein n=1 Tax=Variovorax sp. SRS16 TaxID=282217 RepID=UPI001316C173|nr:hypothetical protein [Variovorax sp. SRS16]VTU16518.1 hypothetical protein SRS16CHR_01796 [Variovorax sp. SRS16]